MTYTKETTMEKGTKATCTSPGVAWLPIPGWPAYEVSDCAEPMVRNVQTGKVLKKRGEVLLYDKGRRCGVGRARALWCARHGADPSKLPAGHDVSIFMVDGEPTVAKKGSFKRPLRKWRAGSPEEQRFLLTNLAAFHEAQLRYLDSGDTAAMAAFLRGYKALAASCCLRFRVGMRRLGYDALGALLEEAIAVLCERLRSGYVVLSTPERAVSELAMGMFTQRRRQSMHATLEAAEAINARRGGGSPWS